MSAPQASVPFHTPFCHGEMRPMSERAGYLCPGCGATTDYETVFRASIGGFRLVRATLPPPPPEVVT